MRATPDPSPPTSAASERAWLAPGLVAAAALFWLRSGVIEALARHERGVEPALAAWAAFGRAGSTAVHALALGVCAAAVAWYGAAGNGARAFAGFGLASLFLFSALSGWPAAPAIDVALASGPGLSNAWTLAALALGGALALLGARPVLERAHLARKLESPLVLAALALVLGGAAFASVAVVEAPTMVLREVVSELVRPARWTVKEQDEAHPMRAGVLSPLVDFRFDSADKPALVMPPPCTLELVVAQDEGDSLFSAAAAADISLRQLLAQREREMKSAPPDGALVRVRFEIEVDGVAAFERVLEVRSDDFLRAGGRESECAWVHARGIPLRAGQRVTLRTSLPDYPDGAPEAARGLAVGFGGLTLDRWHERERTRASPERPSVLLVVMDTQRADRLSCYGYEKPTTPHLDRLAARGLLFENAFATSSWTWPSTASILTGLLPDEHGVTSNASCTLHLEADSLAEALQQRGFTTAAVACNPLIAAERYFDQGFERFDGAPRMRKTGEVIDLVLATLERLADQRFFLYLHFVDPHTPHQPLPAELARLGGERPDDFPDVERDGAVVDGLDNYATRLLKGEALDGDGAPNPSQIIPESHARWMNDAYDASVATGDHYCGLVLDALERLGLAETTVVAFTSDHGEELLDHGLLAHGHTVHRELVRVPLILAGPGLPEGARVANEVSNRHLATTLARIGGADLPRAADGLNLLAGMPPPQSIFYQTEKGYWNGAKGLALYGLREDGYVLHRAPQGAAFGASEPDPNGAQRLYSIEDDPMERVDLSRRAELGGRASSLSTRVEELLHEQRARRRGAASGAGPSALTTLQGVGYLDSEEPLEALDEDEERP